MISGIIAFSIFITNPTGVKDAAYDTTVRYIAAGEKVPETYSDSEDCLDDLKKVRKNLKKKIVDLEAISGHETDDADADTFNTEIDSMRCLGINRFGKVVDQDGVKPAPVEKVKKNTVEVWRVGRFDEDQVFYGTAYDTKVYDDVGACDKGYHKAINLVADKAIKDGATGSQSVEMIDKFKETYNCEKITIERGTYERRVATTSVEEEMPTITRQTQPVASAPSVPMNAQPSPQVVEAQPQGGFYQVPGPVSTTPPSSPVTQYRNYPLGLPRLPTRPYYMAENSRGYDGTWRWLRYQTVFQSPAQCWQAVREFLSNEEQNLQRSYSAMQPSYGAADWYRTSMDALTYRRTHLSCVTADN